MTFPTPLRLPTGADDRRRAITNPACAQSINQPDTPAHRHQRPDEQAARADAITRHWVPDIFNIDQGWKFTVVEFTGRLQHHGIQPSMDGKGKRVDNVFVKRPWKSVNCEYV